MGVIAWIVFGFIVGLVARALMPGPQKMGIIPTTGLGVVGSFIGGTIGNLITGNQPFHLASSGFIGSVLGALGVMLLVGFIGRRRHRRVTV
jgi:uncharacterized membrane protein YeaQ/YmgE (transglycosylase-associated protein family)